MAIVQRRVDDIDNETDAEHINIKLSFQGKAVTLDLNDKNFKALEKALEKWLAAGTVDTTSQAARRSAGRGSSGSGTNPERSEALKEARVWLQSNGHSVGDKGKIAQSLLDVYTEKTKAVIPD